MASDEILLKPYLEHLWKNKFKVVLCTGVLIFAALVITFFLKPIYRATAVVITPASSTITPGQALAGLASPLSILHGIGDSASTFMEVGKEVGMDTQTLRESLNFEQDGVYSQLVIAAQTPSKGKSRQIVEATLKKMRATASNLSFTMAEQQVKQLEGVVLRKERELLASQDTFAAFQKTLKTAPDQTNPLVSTQYLARLQTVELELGKVGEQLKVLKANANRLAQPDYTLPSGIPNRDKYRDQIIQQEYDLSVALTKYGPRAPEVEQLRRNIQVAKTAFATELRRYLDSVNQDYDVNVANLEAQRISLEWQRDYVRELQSRAPEEAIAYSRQLRLVQNAQNDADLVRKQLEDARISSEVYKFVWTVLQDPVVESTPINKKYGLIALLSGVASLILVITVMCTRLSFKMGKEF